MPRSIIIWLFGAILLAGFITPAMAEPYKTSQGKNPDESVLRHIVLFKFKDGTPAADIAKFEAAFGALPARIPEIRDYEWGLNNSPEGLDKGLTHCFLVTFGSEADRDIYLSHPDHQAFVSLISPAVEDVVVVDYWSR